MIENSQFSIYDTTYQPSVCGLLKFEIKSLIGRLVIAKQPPNLEKGPQLLNLGCGLSFYPEFVNADFFKLKRRSPGPNFWGLDLRYPLKCPDNHWDGIFTEHTLEHLHPERTLALLSEIYRTLKSGCWVRIVVPDLAKYVDYYSGKSSHEKFSVWQPRGASLRSVAQNYQHMGLWDSELMMDCLTRAGFMEIRQRIFREGADNRLLKDQPEREFESLYIEARKV
jgi:hypothetical protein